jgi:hypothetical protein
VVAAKTAGLSWVCRLARDSLKRYGQAENKKPRVCGAFCGVSVLHGTLSYTQLVPRRGLDSGHHGPEVEITKTFKINGL